MKDILAIDAIESHASVPSTYKQVYYPIFNNEKEVCGNVLEPAVVHEVSKDVCSVDFLHHPNS